jgi:hypothetical protein
MKTLLNPKDKEEIIARLQGVRPTSLRLWGKMSVHQMVCHLSDGFKMYMGLKPVSPVNVPYPRSLLKWVALWAPIRWPKGFNTAPELDQQVGGTLPVEFDNDVRELQRLVSCFYATAQRLPVAGSSPVWQDVREGMDEVGIPSHGSSFAAIRSVKGLTHLS